jgi:long-chain acyl-CoA synthetase
MKRKTTPTPLGHSLLEFKNRTAPKAIMYKRGDRWISRNWPEYFSDIEVFGAGLLALGVQPQERVAIMANTRYEWSVADHAAMGVHAIVISVYQNNTPSDVAYILNDSESSVLIFENESLLRVWHEIESKCPHVKHIILMDPPKNPVGKNVYTWTQIEDKGRETLKKNPTIFTDLCQLQRMTDTATLLYTSGTTGLPKGVVITHIQIISEISEAFTIFGVDDTDVSLTFLPYAHILGRIEHWAHAYMGYTMAFAESIEKVRNNLAEIEPTFLISVPRIFEKVYAAISTQIDSSPMKKKLFTWAIGVGHRITELKLTHQTIPLELLATYELARKLVLNKISLAFGRRLRFAISGGAPLASDISSFFHAAGVLILEGYGLTETTAAITVNTPFNYKFGSVGRAIGDVEIKIAEDGEILIRSNKVMKEYYKNPQATAEVMTDGWFHTGDIGQILQGGDLKITDRKKDLIKTAGGKYVAPQKIEGLLKLSPLITQALIAGDQKKYIVALLTVDPIYMQALAKERGDSFNDWRDLVSRPWVQDIVRDHIAETNADLATYESIKRFMILPVEFTIEGGELTPSLKLKRKVLSQRYQSEIDSLYS